MPQRFSQFRRPVVIGIAMILIAFAYWFKRAHPITITPVDRYTFDVPTSTASEFSGLTYAGGDLYYAVSDNDALLYPLRIAIDPSTGAIKSFSIEKPIQLRDAAGAALADRDLEGVAFNPSHNSVYVSDETGPTLREHRLADGHQIGPDITSSSASQLRVYAECRPNQGWETLARRGSDASLFIANQDSLTIDGPTSALGAGGVIRFQRLDSNLQPTGQWAYPLDAGEPSWVRLESGCVSDALALDDGSLIVLERAIGSDTPAPTTTTTAPVIPPTMRIRLYRIHLTSASHLNGGSRLNAALLSKHLLWETFLSNVNAQFEGIAIGPRLNNGDHSLLLIADNSGGTKHSIYALRITGL